MDQKIILGLLWISAATVVAVDFDFEQHDNDNCESQQQHFPSEAKFDNSPMFHSQESEEPDCIIRVYYLFCGPF